MSPEFMTRSMTAADGWSPDPVGRPIPKPDIPLAPVPGLADLVPGRRGRVPSLLDRPASLLTADGRTALAAALDAIGVGPGDEVLLPSWHCPAMVEPILATGAAPVLYPILPSLEADLGSLGARVGGRARALIGVNYFGFPGAPDALRAFCDGRGIAFIEDCAHSLFGSHLGRPLGGFGDYAIASLRKFLPVEEGGLLVAAGDDLPGPPPEGRPARGALRSWFSLVETACRHGRLPALRPAIALARGLRGKSVAAGPVEGEAGDPDSAPPRGRPSPATRFLARRARAERIAGQRRARYREIVAGLAGLPGCRPLKPELPEGVVPFMVPLRVETLPAVFARLEDAAIPMQRFGQFLWRQDGVEPDAVALDLSRHGVQLPCHQDLRTDEVESLVRRFASVVRAAA